MTISSTAARIDYTGDGVSTAFPVPFDFFDNSELRVISRVIATGIETVKALTTDYTVSGGAGSTGTVTAVTAPASTVQWTILRNTRRTQDVDYQPNDPFPAETHEMALDRIVATVQEIERDAGRSLRAAETDTSGTSLTLPSSVDRALKVLAFDADGAPVASVPESGSLVVTSYMQEVLASSSAGIARVNLGIIWGGTAGGTANAITLAPSPSVAAYGDGQMVRFLASATNTGNVTISFGGGVVPLRRADASEVPAGLIYSGLMITATYDGTQFRAGEEIETAICSGSGIISAATSAAIVLPSRFRFFEFNLDLGFSNDTAGVAVQTSITAGSPYTYDSGASDYQVQFTYTNTATTLTSGVVAAMSSIGISPGGDNGATSGNNLRGTITPGGTRFPRINTFGGGALDVGAGGFQGVLLTSGIRLSATRITAIRFIPTAGTFTGWISVRGVL